MKRKARSVVWAVDPFQPETRPHPAVVRELADLARRASLELVPAYVVTVLEKNWEFGELPHVPELQAGFERYLARYPISSEAPARLVIDDIGTYASAAQALLELALEEGAAWITVSTHGRGGVGRLMFGSFAEKLLERSTLPVLFLPREAPPASDPGTRVVLFPTDLSASAHTAFRNFLSVAERQRFEVVILHALSLPVPSLDFGLGPVGLGPVLPENFVRDQTTWAEERGSELVKEAGSHGVRARFTLETGIVPSITGDAVLRAARRERAHMIAMVSHDAPVTHFVAGSVAQEVFRTGRMLTWLYGPKATVEGTRAAA
jgi:nucleotide-binding universal stress UspA family protein